MPPVSADLSLPWNHVFVDFENVHELDFAALGNKPAGYTLLLGAKQTRLDAGLVEELIKHGGAVELIRLTSSGRNALDFALAYYVGRAAVLDPGGYFHIVSKDQGFDPLIEHLKSRHIRAYRHPDFSTLSFSGPSKVVAALLKPSAGPGAPLAPAALPDLPLEKALMHLRKNTNNRPKREKTLISHLKNLLGKAATETDAIELTYALKAMGYLRINDKGAVTYHLPPG